PRSQALYPTACHARSLHDAPPIFTDSFPGIDYFEANGIPFVVGVNLFDGAPRYPTPEIREALGVTPDTPIVECDARNKDSVKMVLLTLLEYLVAKAQARAHMR